MRYVAILPIAFIFLTVSSCSRNQQNPYHYFAGLQQFRLNIMNESVNYTRQRKTDRDTGKEERLKKELITLLLQTEDSLQNYAFTQDDFGLKKAILHEFAYTRSLLTDTGLGARSRDTTLSIEERAAALDSMAAMLRQNTTSINNQIRKSQLAFVRFYRIPVTIQ